MYKTNLIAGLLCVFFIFSVASCKAERKKRTGGPYYFATFVGYHMPPRLSEEMTYEEAVKSDYAYYVAYYDEGRLISLTKHYKGKVLFNSKYFYRSSGKLERREETDDKGETNVYYYDEKGKLIKDK